jgi:hypothetical protein
LSFLLKAVLILIIFSFVVFVLKAIARLSFRLQGTVKEMRRLREQLGVQPPPAGAEMVRCAACGAFVAARDALTLSARGRAQAFCSKECIQAHAKSA